MDRVKRTVLLGLSLSGFALALLVVLLISACRSQTQSVPAAATTTAASTPAPAQAAASATPPASPSAAPASDLNATITKVDISTDGKVTVSYKLMDKKGNPVSRSSLDPNRERFSIGHIVVAPDTGYTQWLSYVVSDVDGAVYKLNGKDTQPALAHVTGVPVATADSTVDFKEIAVGQYTYTLKTVLPAGYDKNATTRVIYQASMNNVAAVANATFDFVPAGGPVTVTRQVVATDNCNKCHDPLAVHGGSRRDTKMCVICHTPQNVDPASGNVVDFKIYIHKIHDNSNLPSVQAGTVYHVGSTDFSGIVWPQDIRNCTTCHSNAPNADN